MLFKKLGRAERSARERCWRAEKLRGTPKVAVNRCLWSRLIASKSRASRQPSQRSLTAAYPGLLLRVFLLSSSTTLARPIPVSLLLPPLPSPPLMLSARVSRPRRHGADELSGGKSFRSLDIVT